MPETSTAIESGSATGGTIAAAGVSHLTQERAFPAVEWFGERGEVQLSSRRDDTMLTAIIITFIIVAVPGFALWLGQNGGPIARRPYNNRYNDASGARDESFI